MCCETNVPNAEMRQQLWYHLEIRWYTILDADRSGRADAGAVGVYDPDVVSSGEGVEGRVGEAAAKKATKEEDDGGAGGRAVIGVGDPVSSVVGCVFE